MESGRSWRIAGTAALGLAMLLIAGIVLEPHAAGGVFAFPLWPRLTRPGEPPLVLTLTRLLAVAGTIAVTLAGAYILARGMRPRRSGGSLLLGIWGVIMVAGGLTGLLQAALGAGPRDLVRLSPNDAWQAGTGASYGFAIGWIAAAVAVLAYGGSRPRSEPGSAELRYGRAALAGGVMLLIVVGGMAIRYRAETLGFPLWHPPRVGSLDSGIYPITHLIPVVAAPVLAAITTVLLYVLGRRLGGRIRHMLMSLAVCGWVSVTFAAAVTALLQVALAGIMLAATSGSLDPLGEYGAAQVADGLAFAVYVGWIPGLAAALVAMLTRYRPG